MNKLKVAIQGIKGSYHHRVAQLYFGEAVELDQCLSFAAVVQSIETGQSSDAIMAIENSIAGTILPNYAYIDEHNLVIRGEYFLPIHHCLMALKGQDISAIKEVHSHPMALLQCKAFFRNYPHIKLVEEVDTADVARKIQAQQLEGIAAIAGATAASIYDLNILAQDIQTIKTNSTRFFILNKQKASNWNRSIIDKASLKFITAHKRGSLAAVLNMMNDYKLNLTKIQSLPVIDKAWQYAFFVDLTFDQYEDFTKAIAVLKTMTLDLKILGEYKNQR